MASHSNLLYHIVFATKNREAFLVDEEVRGRVWDYLGGLVKSNGGEALAINGMADHVHLLVRLEVTVYVPDFLRELKAVSSEWIHCEFSGYGDFAWQEGYAIFSVSYSRGSVVRRYIDNQREHHKEKNSRDELRFILENHGVVIDERYFQ